MNCKYLLEDANINFYEYYKQNDDFCKRKPKTRVIGIKSNFTFFQPNSLKRLPRKYEGNWRKVLNETKSSNKKRKTSTNSINEIKVTTSI